MKRVTDGVTRTVYLAGPWAIKVPSIRYSWRLFLRGLLSNMNERDTWAWSGIPDWAGPPRAILAPVRWCSPGGWLLVMDRATRMATDDEFEASRASFPSISDMKSDNVGVFGHGTLLAIDYGEGWTCVEAEHERRGTPGDES